MAKFLVKMSLKRYQRALISAFKDYRLDDLREDNKANEKDSQTQIRQEGGDAILSPEQKSLLRNISTRFDATKKSDSMILYEITGFKAGALGEEFWEGYLDFGEV
jgi:hypothetical protein